MMNTLYDMWNHWSLPKLQSLKFGNGRPYTPHRALDYLSVMGLGLIRVSKRAPGGWFKMVSSLRWNSPVLLLFWWSFFHERYYSATTLVQGIYWYTHHKLQQLWNLHHFVSNTILYHILKVSGNLGSGTWFSRAVYNTAWKHFKKLMNFLILATELQLYT